METMIKLKSLSLSLCVPMSVLLWREGDFLGSF